MLVNMKHLKGDFVTLAYMEFNVLHVVVAYMAKGSHVFLELQ